MLSSVQNHIKDLWKATSKSALANLNQSLIKNSCANFLMRLNQVGEAEGGYIK